jgi:hypothetical protein
MGQLITLVAANDRRRDTAAEANVAAVRAALERLGDAAPPRLAAAGRLRLDHPTASLAELGELGGMSKDTVAALIRRLLIYEAVESGRPRPRQSMRYRTADGGQQTLTRAQWEYLAAADQVGEFSCGYQGLTSGRTVFGLRDAGLVVVDERAGSWRVTGLTALGRGVLFKWRGC